MNDRGFFLTRQAIRRQLAAMPNELFLVRLIHSGTGGGCAGERLWTATLLTTEATVRFLRARNRQGFDIYIYPYAEGRNSGYTVRAFRILVDLDQPDPYVLSTMRAHGHEPCVVLQSSPGHLQAWVRVSASPLEPGLGYGHWQTVGARLSGRSRQYRLAPSGQAGRLHQSEISAPSSRRLRSLGEVAARPGRMGHPGRRADPDCSAPIVRPRRCRFPL